MIAPSDKGGTQLVWEDWRGNHYTVGSLILYTRMSGRSCELAEGRVADLYEVYYGHDDYKWHRLEPGEKTPEYETWRWKHNETGDIQRYPPSDLDEREAHWKNVEVSVPCETERRAKILPTGRTSRGFGYYNKKWVYDEKTGKGEFVETEQKPVTLKITESITAVTPYDIKDDM